MIECEDAEKGEKILTHIFKYTYLVTRMAMIFKDEFAKGSGEFKAEDLDFSLLRPDIEKVDPGDGELSAGRSHIEQCLLHH